LGKVIKGKVIKGKVIKERACRRARAGYEGA
jgi:hypothetical protein